MRNILEAKKGTQIIDLSAHERTAVMRPCLNCQTDVAVASDFQGILGAIKLPLTAEPFRQRANAVPLNPPNLASPSAIA
ncbi:MAG: hypothetical protein WB607_06160 [Candidatus Acidiferrum sp.]|jgi:hypothetical protein